VIIVVNIQPEYGLVTLISIPRDLYVYIPGYKMQRINAAFYRGEYAKYPGLGPALMKDTILYNLGIEIDYYILVDFDGFINLIDTVGGLDVPVPCDYTDWRIKNPDKDPEDEDNWRLFTVKAGVVHMDGDLALWYARARKKSSDFDRNRRQQEVIRALYSQALNLGWISKVPDLYEELSRSVTTDFTLSDALVLAPQIYDLRSAEVRSFYIDSSVVSGWKSPTGAAVQIPNHAALYALIQEALSPPTLIETAHTQLIIEVWNGTSKSDMDILAAERLHYAGFDTQINISDRLDYGQTLLFDFTTDQDPETQAQLLSLYGLDTAMLISFPDPDYPFDYRLVVGSDFNPCFQPAKIDR
jgi:LCP family protein required for cell wall assembly